MKKLFVTDITIQEAGKNPGPDLNFREKIELAKLLDRTGVDTIALHGIGNPRVDGLLIRSIASAVRHSTLAVPTGLEPSALPALCRALEQAKAPRLQVCAPVSVAQMEYLAGKKPGAILSAVETMIRECLRFCGDVEFVAEDATRAEPEFLREILNCAVNAGAKTVTLCDTAGRMLPGELRAFLEALTGELPPLREIRLGVSCADTLSMADACAAAALEAGASELKAAACGANCISLGHLSALIDARGDTLGVTCGLQTATLHRTLEQIRWTCRTDSRRSEPAEEELPTAAEVDLTAADSRETVLKAAALLGYDLSEEDSAKVYEAFCRIAGQKETVSRKELDAIIATTALQVPPTYRLEQYTVHSGNAMKAMAHVRLKKDDTIRDGISLGNGPIDASFLAIEQILGHHYELDDFQIQSVTEGREAVGRSLVRLRSGGRLYSGLGVSTDIVSAAIHAYLGALNKIVYEEGAE